MTETGRSRWRPTQRTLLLVIVELALVWVFVLLFGWIGVVGPIGGLIGYAILNLGFDRDALAQERAARTAVREYRDPGPDLRAEAHAQARQILGENAASRWAGLLMLPALAVACAVVAVVRDDPAVAFPIPLLLALAAVLVVVRRRADAAADRWLADPPVPAEEVEP